jgi:four helix bundle protein
MSSADNSFDVVLQLALNTVKAHRARSLAEFISKLESAIQELDETVYWIELLVDAKVIAGERLQLLLDEANELMAMLVASVRTAKAKRK